MRIFASTLAGLCILSWMLQEGTLSIFWNGSALFIVLVGGVALFLTAHGTAGFDVFRRPTGVATQASTALPRPAVLAQSLRRCFYSIGIIGAGISMVSVLAKMGDPTALGPTMSAMAYVVFYAVVFAEGTGVLFAERLKTTGAV